MMNANQEVEHAIAHQASQWVTVLRRNASAAELAAFAEWVKTSPRHLRDFLLMSAIEKELHEVDGERKYGAHELARLERSNVSILRGADATKTRTFRPARWAAAIAAIFVVAALAWWQPSFLGGAQKYVTTTGEQRTLELPDGSIVHLNTRSRIEVRMTGASRDIELLAGEALFKVHRDPARPFLVHVRDTAIQAVGTEFNVYRREEGTTVAVLEGKVRIAAPTPVPLDAGEEASIAATGRVTKKPAADVAGAVAWRQRRLVFQDTPLTEMIAEFNRYNSAPQFRLDGAGTRLRHYTGVFDADDPESLVELLSAEPGLKVTQTKETILISERYQ